MSSGSLYSVPEGESIAQQNSGRAPSDHPLLSDLRVLKSMLTEELITQTEYDAKKTDILDRVGVYSTERADWTDAEISERIEQSTKKEWRLNAVSSKKKARRSGSKMNIRGHHNTIDPGLKLLGKRLNYFMLPSRVKALIWPTWREPPPATRAARACCATSTRTLAELFTPGASAMSATTRKW